MWGWWELSEHNFLRSGVRSVGHKKYQRGEEGGREQGS